ncbi:replication terminator protein [Priestia aryabhattai]|uniref:Replication terminator protein n=1 Tax=Priestia aryabhattai TaxID=412384 RepID=A0ABD7X3M3_PRIAR|nr:replication terminator protein [Priestia aryabhattai]WEA47319.1 replication terminator protein [Priestia aryabhattai]
MSQQIIDLNSFADGALAERFNIEFQKVLANVTDPNTDPEKARKLTITVSVKSDKRRKVSNVSVVAKTTLLPARDIQTQVLMDFDANGEVTGAELLSGEEGQMFIDKDGDPATDIGQKVEVSSNVLDLQKKQVNK